MQNKNSKLHTILLIVLIIAVGFLIWRTYGSKAIVIPNPIPSPQMRTVTLGQEFTIQQGEQVVIAGTDGAKFKLTGFYNHPCPPNAQCIWSGLDVFYEIEIPEIITSDVHQEAKTYIKDQPMQHINNAPFSVILRDSDYTTYATIVLQQQGWGN